MPLGAVAVDIVTSAATEGSNSSTEGGPRRARTPRSAGRAFSAGRCSAQEPWRLSAVPALQHHAQGT